MGDTDRCPQVSVGYLHASIGKLGPKLSQERGAGKVLGETT